MRVLKGHGTENDFVLLPDLDGQQPLTPELVRALCDRHAGVGADGVLRIVRSAADPDGQPMAADAPYFMDYRNADGSVAEMCGNGVRVFVRYLHDAGLVDGDALAVATRGGVRRTQLCPDGSIEVEMGHPQLLPERPAVSVAGGVAGPSLAAVLMPNPHVVVQLTDLGALAALDLSRPPLVDPPRPDGQNVEFVVVAAPRHLSMRVNERGVGETRSCGTGICAVVAAVASADGSGPDGSTWRVDVPGGRCEVVWRPDGEIRLRGPAVIVGEIELAEHWQPAQREPVAG